MAIDLTAYMYGYMPLLATGFFALFLSVLMFANLNLGPQGLRAAANAGNVGAAAVATAATGGSRRK
jgi:hypothetical protein